VIRAFVVLSMLLACASSVAGCADGTQPSQPTPRRSQGDAHPGQSSAQTPQGTPRESESSELVSRADARGDTWDFDLKGVGDPPQRRPRRLTNADIAHLWVQHGSHALVIRMWFADLDRDGAMNQFLIKVAIRTNERRRHNVELGWEEPPAPRRLTLTDGDSASVHCDLRGKIDWIQNTTWVRVPTSCLSDPRWLRVAVVADSVHNYYSLVRDDALTGTVPVGAQGSASADIESPFPPDAWTRRLMPG
jgi:hypothetical protein